MNSCALEARNLSSEHIYLSKNLLMTISKTALQYKANF